MVISNFTHQELYDKVQAVKSFLNKEVVRMRLSNDEEASFTAQEIYHKLDLIREAERMGFRHLDSRLFRKVEKMVTEVEGSMGLPGMN